MNKSRHEDILDAEKIEQAEAEFNDKKSMGFRYTVIEEGNGNTGNTGNTEEKYLKILNLRQKFGPRYGYVTTYLPETKSTPSLSSYVDLRKIDYICLPLINVQPSFTFLIMTLNHRPVVN